MAIMSNATLLDDDCSDISGWADDDTGNGISSQVTYDSKSCFSLNGGTPAGSGYRARRSIDVGSFGNRVVVSLSAYFYALGTVANNDAQFKIFTGGVKCEISVYNNKLYVNNADTGWVEVGSSIISGGVWTELTFDIDFTTPASATVDVYKDTVLQGGGGTSCNKEGTFTDGLVVLGQQVYSQASRQWYCDWIKVGDDFTSDSVNVDPGPVGLVTSLTGEATSEGNIDVDPGPIPLTATPVGSSPENDPITLTTSLEGVVLSAHIDCDSIPLTTSLDGTRLEATIICDPIVITISVEGESADITVFPDPIEVVVSLTGDYSEFIVATPIEVTLGLAGGYAHEYIVIANPIEIGTTLTADWPNVLVSPGPIPLTTRLLGEGVITDKAEIILYFYSNGQLITTKTIPLTPAITDQEWLRTRFPIELKGRHLSIKVECTGANRETYLYDYGLDLRILNER